MESKKQFGKQLGQFLEGHGFYMVMLLCAVIIGVSIWSLLKKPADFSPDEPEFDETLSEVLPVEYQPEMPDLNETEPEEIEQEIEETASELTEVWPVEGVVQRDYSMDKLQYDQTMSDWRTHDGVDISAEVGTKVMALRSGTVTKIASDDLYGTSVWIDHGNGLEICYANLEQIPTVYEGDTVSAGDVIGSVGETAKCESAQDSHLHLSAKLNGESANPVDYLPQKT